MRTHRLLSAFRLAVLCLLSLSVSAQKPPDQLRPMSPDELGMVKVLLAQERAWNDASMEGFLASYKNSPETVMVNQNVLHGWTQIDAHYRASYPNKETMGTLSFSELEPHLLDASHGFMTGVYRLERGKKFGGNAEGIFSLVMEKTSDGWKIILDHTT